MLFILFALYVLNRLDLINRLRTHVCGLCISDDVEALPVRQFLKHIMELHANSQHGFSQEFDVSMVFVVGVCVLPVHIPVLPVAQRHRWLWEKD